MSDKEVHELSDEEILQMETPPASAGEEPEVVTEEPVTQEQEPTVEAEDHVTSGSEDGEDNTSSEEDDSVDGESVTDTAENTDTKRNPLNDPDDGEVIKEEPEKNAGQEPEGNQEKSEETQKETKADKEPEDSKGETDKEKDTVEDTVDYKSFYDSIMGKPLRANGKDIQLQSVDEAIQLMQMGANYTKKLQMLQPNLRMVKMLESKGLMNEDKLTFLIDLHNKEPSAIQKLLKDSNIDPLDIDTTAESNYKPGNHTVSDNQIAFDNVIDEITTDVSGQNVVVDVSKNWDKSSQQEIFRDPQILVALSNQKKSGIYDRISGEIERKRLLGQLTGLSALQAYYKVGKELDDANGFADLVSPQQTQETKPVVTAPAKQVLATRVAKPKPADPTNEKAKAALPVKTTPRSNTKADDNPLSMNDEDFMKTADLAKRL